MSLQTLMWLFLVVFMIHEFEEIIMTRSWYLKNEGYIKARFSRIASRLLTGGRLSTPAFTLAILEEFVVMSILVLACTRFGLYSMGAGAIIAFSAHLVMHIGSFLLLRRYVPNLLTSLPGIIYAIYALIAFNNAGYLFSLDTLVWTAVLLAVGVANLFAILSVAERFDRWLKRWSSTE